MVNRSDMWRLRGASKSDIEAYARRVAELYLWAPIEHERGLERMLNTACDRIDIDPSAVLEEVRIRGDATDGQDV